MSSLLRLRRRRHSPPPRAAVLPPRQARPLLPHGWTQPELRAVAARPRRLRPGQRAHPRLLQIPGVPPHQVGVPLRPQRRCLLQP
jgi:hypothetical protein